MTAARPRAVRPLRDRPRSAATEVAPRPRTPIRTARKAIPRMARHAVKAAPPTPASAPNRASGPSIPNSAAAVTAAALPTRTSRSRAMAAHRIGGGSANAVDERPPQPRAGVGAAEPTEHGAEGDGPDQRWAGQRDPELDPEDRAGDDPDASADELGDLAQPWPAEVHRVVRLALPADNGGQGGDRAGRPEDQTPGGPPPPPRGPAPA